MKVKLNGTTNPNGAFRKDNQFLGFDKDEREL